MKGTRFSNGLMGIWKKKKKKKKKMREGCKVIFSLWMTDPHNSGFAQRIFFILHNGKAKKYTKIIFMFFSKKCLRQMDYLSTIMVHADNSGSTPRHVLKFCTVKGAKRQINILIFSPKEILFGAIGPFWGNELL